MGYDCSYPGERSGRHRGERPCRYVSAIAVSKAKQMWKEIQAKKGKGKRERKSNGEGGENLGICN